MGWILCNFLSGDFFPIFEMRQIYGKGLFGTQICVGTPQLLVLDIDH